jgi:F-type H+-transporting ATPase subunit b
MELFKIDPGLAIWTWIVFGILLLLLWKYAFPSLMQGIRERENSIARSVDNAALIEQRLADIEQEHAETMSRARAEADEILRRTREEAQEVRRKLLERAEQEAREVLEQAREKIQDERAAATQAMRREIAGLVCDASEKIIGRSFTSREDRDWAEGLAKTL